jgi:hypothetical protein
MSANEDDKQEILKDFEAKLLANMKALPPELVHIVSDNFWDILYYEA